MFQVKGEFYCINGCFQYPINMETVMTFLDELPQITNINEIICYDIEPKLFSYEKAMEDEYVVSKIERSSLPIKTLLRLDFCHCGESYRLQMEPLDDTYYSISLMHSCEDKIDEENHRFLIETFYSILKPIYGNDGIEKGVLSVNQVTKKDYDLFNNNCFISDCFLKRMQNGVLCDKENIVRMESGIYFLKQSIATAKLLFSSFVRVVLNQAWVKTR